MRQATKSWRGLGVFGEAGTDAVLARSSKVAERCKGIAFQDCTPIPAEGIEHGFVNRQQSGNERRIDYSLDRVTRKSISMPFIVGCSEHGEIRHIGGSVGHKSQQTMTGSTWAAVHHLALCSIRPAVTAIENTEEEHAETDHKLSHFNTPISASYPQYRDGMCGCQPDKHAS